MKESPFPLETALGLTYYISDTPGTGGTLKKEPEDFVVEEIPIRTPNQQGSYMICRVTMKNWEQQHAVKEIANRLGASHRRIGWAGTKDKRALTTQYLSLYKKHQNRSQTFLSKILRLNQLALRTSNSIWEI